MKKDKEKLKERIKNLTIKISQIYIAIQSKETPWFAKAIGYITIGYFLSPIDLIPDFIPVLGYLDDLIILPLLIWLCIKLIPKDIYMNSEESAKRIWNEKIPSKWYFAIPIVGIWIILLIVIFKIVIEKII